MKNKQSFEFDNSAIENVIYLNKINYEEIK